jgi:hypothetical protein
MVMRQVLLLSGIGVAIGIPVALGTARLVSSMLFGVKGTDAWRTGSQRLGKLEASCDRTTRSWPPRDD